ncbi:hypothetical protein B0H16DRAFT_1878366 [Mycena metata]|uniref:protein-tyrosine-phosphatase n=1 Tax=Mycena metata TaxID=1033252 RepID=A0AAD7K6X7_9AGAR|nr:hypothetical protein B0H16DRAFT_1878366 [Mycena metata]
MCTPMHQILPPTPLPPSSHTHPFSSSPYAPYGNGVSQQPRISGALYLGSLTAANDHPLLRSHGITHLVQAPDASWAPPDPRLGRFFDGVFRSPSIIIAYLIRNHAMSYADALAFVKRRRACAKPNPGFARALVANRARSRRAFNLTRRYSFLVSTMLSIYTLVSPYTRPRLVITAPAIIYFIFGARPSDSLSTRGWDAVSILRYRCRLLVAHTGQPTPTNHRRLIKLHHAPPYLPAAPFIIPVFLDPRTTYFCLR